MRTSSQKLLEKWYPPDQYDSDSLLLRLIEQSVGPESRVLDAGAGAGEKFAYNLKGRVAEMAGADLDARVQENPQLDRGILADLTKIPVPDNCFDVVFCRYVLEHVAAPEKFLAEMFRVLKPGGAVHFRDPKQMALCEPGRAVDAPLVSRMVQRAPERARGTGHVSDGVPSQHSKGCVPPFRPGGF